MYSSKDNMAPPNIRRGHIVFNTDLLLDGVYEFLHLGFMAFD